MLQSWAWPREYASSLVPPTQLPVNLLLPYFTQPHWPFSSLKTQSRLSPWGLGTCPLTVLSSRLYSWLIPSLSSDSPSNITHSRELSLVTVYKTASFLLQQKTSTTAFLPMERTEYELGKRGRKEREKNTRGGYTLIFQNIIQSQQQPGNEGREEPILWRVLGTLRARAGKAPKWKCPVVSYFVRCNSWDPWGMKENWTGSKIWLGLKGHGGRNYDHSAEEGMNLEGSPLRLISHHHNPLGVPGILEFSICFHT